ncbi:threonine-phosphate decarboxylase CobD [Trichothermofontia sp.]
MDRPTHGGNLAWAASLAGCSPCAILDFSASINPLGPPPAVLTALQENLLAIRAYPDPGYQALRTALGDCHRSAAEWVLPGNGAAELLTWIGRDLAAQAETYVLTPAFADYGRALRTFGAVAHPVPFRFTPEAITADLPDVLATAPPTAALLLNNPHNPTGKVFPREQILPYLDRFALVVIDEAFMDFLPPAEQQSLSDRVPDFPNLVIVRSLTKFYSLPGLRLGYAIAHPERLRRWQDWRDPWCVNQLAVIAALAALPDHNFQEQTWAWLPPARSHLSAGLAQVPQLQPYASAANFLLVHSQDPVPPLQAQLLQQHRILIRDCLSFPELGEHYFRVAVRTADDHQRLLAAVFQSRDRDPNIETYRQ